MLYLSRARAAAPARASAETWTLSFSCLALYMLFYYFSPEDYFPALETFPIYKLLAGAALGFQVLRNMQHKRPWLTLPPEMRLLIPLFALMIANVAFSNWPGGSAEVFQGRIVKTALLAVLIANAIETEKQYRYMLILMVVSGALLSLYVVYAHLAGIVDRFGRTLGYGEKEFGNPNDLALGLLIIVPFAYQLMRGAHSSFRKVAYAAALAGMVGAIVISMSRMGMVGLCFLAGAWLYSMRKADILKPVAGMLLVAAVVVLAAVAVPSLGERFASIFDSDKDPNRSRSFRLQHMWDGIEIIAQHPVLGVGMGQSAEVIGHKHLFTPGHWERIHSLYIEFGADLGLPALALFVALLVGVIRRLSRAANATTIASAEGLNLSSYLDSARISLYTFMVAVTFAPASYSWAPYILLGLSSAILAISRRSAAAQPAPASTARHGSAARPAIMRG